MWKVGKKMSHLVPVSIACETLGVSSSAICISKKYKPFYRKSPSDKRAAYFDLGGFLKLEDLQKELLEKSKLLVEYLIHIEGMTVTLISKLSGVAFQSIHTHNFGINGAIKIAKAIRDFRPFFFQRFHLYYGYPYTPTNRRIW